MASAAGSVSDRLTAGLEAAQEVVSALRELEWWRHFALRLEPGSDLPPVGAPLLGERYELRRVDGR